MYEFPPRVCSACPMREQCVNPRASADVGRSVFVVEEEERLIRKHLAERETPSFQRRLAKRCGVELAIAGFAQCGGKAARRHGQAQVAFDTNLSAFAYNLRRLGGLMRRDESLRHRLDKALRRLLRRAFAILRALDAYLRPLTA